MTNLNQTIQKTKCAHCGATVNQLTFFSMNGDVFCDGDCLTAYDNDVEQMKAEDMRAEADYELSGWEVDLVMQGRLS